MLVWEKKASFLAFLIYVGTYCVKSYKEVEAEATNLEHIKFGELSYCKYDPRGIVMAH